MSPESPGSLLPSLSKPCVVAWAWAWATDHPSAWGLPLCESPASTLLLSDAGLKMLHQFNLRLQIEAFLVEAGFQWLF